MKMKKILAMGASFALVAALAIGGTMAYLTTPEQSKSNVFTSGDISISLNEDVAIERNGDEIEVGTADGAEYNNVMPGDYLKKEVSVENTGSNDAYVKVTVTVNNYDKIQKIIDAYDENGDDTEKEEGLVDYIFDGWGITVANRYLNETKDMSFKIDNAEVAKDHILHVDSAKRIYESDVAHFSIENWFKSPAEEAVEGYTTAGTASSYYVSDISDYTLCYTYYIELPAGETQKLFNGLNVPAFFTSEELKMFEGLNINVTAQAIQADNFSSSYAAFLTLAAGDELVGTDVDFKDALSQDKEHIVVVLSDDVTYDVAAWAANGMGGASTKTITIYGNGNTIDFNQTNSDWNNIVTANGATLIINDAVVTNSGHNDGPWNRHDLNFACEVEMNNVVSDKAFAFKSDATLNNVTIADANTSDTYAIWIQPNGQTVTLDGCTIDMLDATDGRGIKIDEQYVNAPAKVTLNVKNTTFKTEEKAAILVKSEAGADINVSDIDITNTIDPTNAVWVDEASVASYDVVVVNGCTKILEPSVADSANKLVDALEKGDDVLLADSITVDADTSAAHSAYGDTGVTVDGSVFDGGGKTLTVTNSDGTWDCAVYAKSGTIKNVTVKGAFRGIFMGTATGDVVIDNVVLDDVCYTFNSDGGSKDYSVLIKNSTLNGWTSYSDVHKTVSFENCKFGQGTGGYKYAFCRPYNESTFINCTFAVGYEFDANQASSTFINCYYGETLITGDNIGTLSDGENNFISGTKYVVDNQ